MCLRLIAETDARSVGDIFLLPLYYKAYYCGRMSRLQTSSTLTALQYIAWLLLTPTRVAGVKRSSASENTITKLTTGIVHHKSWGQRSNGKVTGSQEAKHISAESDRVAG